MQLNSIFQTALVAVKALLIYALSSSLVLAGDIESISAEKIRPFKNRLASIVSDNQLNTAAVAIIKNGTLQQEFHFGAQNTNTKASPDTLYNIASITKTITAETTIRLVSKGLLNLDESMSEHWIDPDIKDDSNLSKLTPRTALTHTTGFMNWRFYADDNKLKFVAPPGTSFGYSGEGFNYLARYAEKKLNASFETLVQQEIFTPLGIKNAFMSVNKANFTRIARPLGKEQKFHGYYCYPGGYCRHQGDFSAAGDMVITLGDYATFLVDVMKGNGLSPELKTLAHSVQTVSYEIDCSQSPEALCPTKLGYGLGWNVTELKQDKLIGHSGSDWSTVALSYYYENSKDGLIIFLNAPNDFGITAMVDILKLIDPDSPKLHEYKARKARIKK